MHCRRTGNNDGFLSEAQCKALLDQIVGMTSGGGTTGIAVWTAMEQGVEWALNRLRFTSAISGTHLVIKRTIKGTYSDFQTTDLDEAGLRHAVRTVEEIALTQTQEAEDRPDFYSNEPILHPVLWSDQTHGTDAGACAEVVQRLIAPAESAGMRSTGALRIISAGTAVMDTKGKSHYYPTTEVRCSMTVRDAAGTASGWAGMNHYDLDKIHPEQLAARALDKAERSKNPLAVEPGRYTTILEPQATSDLWKLFIELRGPVDPLDRQLAEQPSGPFGGKVHGRSKINETVLDTRLTMGADPMEPDGGFIPFDRDGGVPFQPVHWIEQGVLKQLAYDRGYALAVMGLDKALPKPPAFRLSAASGVPTTTVDEMIAKTDRGLLVTRLSGVGMVDFPSMLASGYTRDGVWLIEKGKITHPVKNFRFNESPLFIMNNLLDVGTPQRVFDRNGASYMAPAVRVRDFSFVALADAV